MGSYENVQLANTTRAHKLRTQGNATNCRRRNEDSFHMLLWGLPRLLIFQKRQQLRLHSCYQSSGKRREKTTQRHTPRKRIIIKGGTLLTGSFCESERVELSVLTRVWHSLAVLSAATANDMIHSAWMEEQTCIHGLPLFATSHFSLLF